MERGVVFGGTLVAFSVFAAVALHTRAAREAASIAAALAGQPMGLVTDVAERRTAPSPAAAHCSDPAWESANASDASGAGDQHASSCDLASGDSP